MDASLARLFAEPDDRTLAHALGQRLSELAATAGLEALTESQRVLVLVTNATACVNSGLEVLLTDEWFLGDPEAVPAAFVAVGLTRAAGWFERLLERFPDRRLLHETQAAMRQLAAFDDPEREYLFGRNVERDIEVVRALAAFARARQQDFAQLQGPFEPERAVAAIPPPDASAREVGAWLMAAGHGARIDQGGVRLTPDRNDTDTSLAQLAGFAACADLDDLDLSHTLVTARGLGIALQFPRLQALDLSATSLGDAECGLLAAKVSLERLDLSDTKITDRGVARLAGLEQLRWLALDRTTIGDRALQRLTSLRSLAELRVGETRVTPPAIAAFRDALPKCRVFTDDDEADGREICARR